MIEAQANNQTLLIVDDSITRHLVRTALSDNGYSVLHAGDSQSAVERAANHRSLEPGSMLQVTQAPSPGTGRESTSRRRLVLVVHDDPFQTKLLKLHLETMGYEVEVAVDGFDALNQARHLPPDAIISDVIMPRLDGFGLCARVRSDPRLARIPVILISVTRTEGEDRNLAESMGADGPFRATPSFAEVKQAILAHLG